MPGDVTYDGVTGVASTSMMRVDGRRRHRKEPKTTTFTTDKGRNGEDLQEEKERETKHMDTFC